MNQERFKHYMVNILAIDAEHLELFNIMHEATILCRANEKELAISAVIRVREKLVLHVATEEAYMHSIDFKYLKAHTEAHRNMLWELDKLITKMHEFKMHPHRIAELLELLLLNHIDHWDMQFAPHNVD